MVRVAACEEKKRVMIEVNGSDKSTGESESDEGHGACWSWMTSSSSVLLCNSRMKPSNQSRMEEESGAFRFNPLHPGLVCSFSERRKFFF